MKKMKSIKNIFKINKNNGKNNLLRYKKKGLTIKKENNKLLKDKEKEEKIDEEDDLNNKSFEYAKHFLKIVESIHDRDEINSNNYSEDDDNGKNKLLYNKSSISEDDNNDNNDEMESLDKEIKELEEDENNILSLMKKIKEFSSNYPNN